MSTNTPIDLYISGSLMSPRVGCFAKLDAFADNPELLPRVDHWKMHPMQFASIMNQGAGIEPATEWKGKELIGVHHNFVGIKLVEDPLMREDEIHLCDKDGMPLVRILAVGKPHAVDTEANKIPS